jgi:TetR/AcrR family transcriptional regulator
MGIQERKEREKEHRKEEILDAAQKVFFEKGLTAATMDEIAESAELSKGTLYLYYSSKEDLYLAVMMRGMQILFEMINKITNSKKKLVDVLLDIIHVYKKFFDLHRSYFRMFAFFQTPQFHKQVSPEMKEYCSINNNRVWDLVTGLLKKGMEEGIIRKELNPVEIAIILWSSSTALMLRLDNENDIWKEKMKIDLSRTLDTSNRLFFESILTKTGRAQLNAA